MQEYTIVLKTNSPEAPYKMTLYGNSEENVKSKAVGEANREIIYDYGYDHSWTAESVISVEAIDKSGWKEYKAKTVWYWGDDKMESELHVLGKSHLHAQEEAMKIEDKSIRRMVKHDDYYTIASVRVDENTEQD